MRFKWMPLIALLLGASAWLATAALHAQARGQDANITIMDNCAQDDPAYGAFGGCPEGAPFPGSNSYRGDVPLAEFFELLTSPLAPAGMIIGHPSWRNEPSYISVREGQNVRVTNRGGRGHTFTEVTAFGGGFVPPLNGALVAAPECLEQGELVVLRYGASETLTELDPGLHKFQCCIHPWMRGAVRVE
jgi:plastocyanin